jgi:hypothetical protein
MAPTMRQQRPNDPCVLIRQRDRGDIGVAPCGQTRQPAVSVLDMADVMPQNRARPMYQQRARVCVAALADAQEACVSTARVLARHQSHPRRELPTILKRPRIANTRCERGRAEPADAGNCLQALTRLVFAMYDPDLPLELSEVAVKISEVGEQARKEFPTEPRAVLDALQSLRGRRGCGASMD